MDREVLNFLQTITRHLLPLCGCPPELHGKTLLLMTPYSLVGYEQREVKLSFCWLAFIVPQDGMQDAGGELLLTDLFSHGPCLSHCWPPRARCAHWCSSGMTVMGGTSCFMTGLRPAPKERVYNYPVSLVESLWLERPQALVESHIF